MVYCFMIHSYEKVEKLPFLIYVSCCYTKEGNTPSKQQWRTAIIHQVMEAVRFYKENKVEQIQPSPYDKGTPFEQRIEGVFRVPAGKVFSTPKIVLWKLVHSCAYTLICEVDENRLLASNFLELFPSILNEHFKNPQISAQPKEFLVKPEEVLLPLHHFLPNGQLLFMNQQLLKQLKRDVDDILMSKS